MPSYPASPYIPVSVKGYQWLLVGALVKRGIAFIGDDQPGWRIWGIGLATGAHKPGKELGQATTHHFPPPIPLDPVETLSPQRGAGPEEEGKRGRLRTNRDRYWQAGSRWSRGGLYLVRAMTLFFLGCWLTGLPMLPFFREPFRASSRCFSAGKHGKEVVSCPQGHSTLLLGAA